MKICAGSCWLIVIKVSSMKQLKNIYIYTLTIGWVRI